MTAVQAVAVELRGREARGQGEARQGEARQGEAEAVGAASLGTAPAAVRAMVGREPEVGVPAGRVRVVSEPAGVRPVGLVAVEWVAGAALSAPVARAGPPSRAPLARPRRSAWKCISRWDPASRSLGNARPIPVARRP